MWECAYGKEPLDGKLLVLRLIKKIWVFFVAALLGAVACGSIYFLQKIVFGEGVTYEAASTYYVDYGTDPLTENAFTYINGATWNDMWIKSDAFVADILEKTGKEAAAILGEPLTADMVKGYFSADLPSDLRMPTTTVKTPNEELTMLLKAALEEEMVAFGTDGGQKEINGIRVVISPTKAEKTVIDNRTVRACVLGAILAVFFTFVVMVICFVADDSIYVPTTFEYRYGIPMLGTIKSPELLENFKTLCGGKDKLSLVCVDEEVAVTDVAEELKERLGNAGEKVQLVGMPGILTCPEALDRVKETEGLLLLVCAGARDGKRIEYMLNLLKKHEITVTAALLIREDEGLQKAYYLPGIVKKNAAEV